MKKTCYLLFTIGVSCLSACQDSDSEEMPPRFLSDEFYHVSGEVQTLLDNDPSGINLVLLGDGFIKHDLRKGGQYEKKAEEMIRYLFTIPPFSTYQKYFNAYIVYAESKQRRLDGQNTIFRTHFLPPDDRLIVDYDNNLRYYISRAVPSEDAHIVVVLANTTRGRGTGRDIAVTDNSLRAKEVMAHEVGHTFAGLADEYVEAEKRSGSADRYSNVDNHDHLDTIKWAHFIGRKGYEAVAAYEGGLFVESGIWRPEETSIMRSTSVGYFNAPSREAIVKRIFEIKGIPYSLEAFLETDVIPVPSSARTSEPADAVLSGCMVEIE